MTQRSGQRYFHRSRHGAPPPPEQSFRCVRCGLVITCDPLIAGVQNRNHCPCCLWSRHLDARAAGDRRSGCRAAMRPIGITTKRSRNRYASERDGELMLIHRCTQCARLSINRIAADDSIDALLDLFERSCALEEEDLAAICVAGVDPLAATDRGLLLRHLLGRAEGPGALMECSPGPHGSLTRA